MDKLKSYILSNFSLLFFSIFLPLFSIASVVFIIKLATMTAIIQLSIAEMLKLYVFVLPDLLFYTLPITFFMAAAMSLHKLSSDNEMTVVFALGIQPSQILKILLLPAVILTLTLFFIVLILFPHAKILSTNFIQYKTSEAKFNLGASEFGHSFGDWMLYIGKDDKHGNYGNVFLFHKSDNEEILIGAKHAEVISQNGIMKLKLHSGEGYSYTDHSLSQMNFDSMIINDMMTMSFSKYENPIEFWIAKNDSERIQKRKHRRLAMYIILSLFPLLSLFSVMGIGIVNARHQQGHLYLSIFVTILLYYGAALTLNRPLEFYAVPLVVVVWLATTYYLYRSKVVARF